MVHPAPLISSAPVPKRDSMPRCGKHPGSEASAMLHVHGRYSNHVPKIHRIAVTQGTDDVLDMGECPGTNKPCDTDSICFQEHSKY